LCEGGVLAQEIADAESSERLPTAIAEEPLGRGVLEAGLDQEATQNLRGLRPERAEALLASLAAQAHLLRAIQLQVHWA
jgi:hypothetical protein